MATLQGKAVKNTYRQVLQIGANNVGVSGTAQRVQDGAGVNTALSLSTIAATIHGDLTITGDLIITGGGIQIQDLIDDTVATLIQNGTGITWAYNDGARTLTPTITIATADGGVQGDFLQLNTGANEASAVGKLKWNATDGTMDIGLMGGNVILQVGQEQVARVLNNSGTNFTEAGYQAVKITSAQGQRLAVGLAQANNEANSKDTLGLVTENISNNQEGFITTSGLVRQIDTTGDLQTEVWVDGDTLYLSPSVPGGVTKVKPLAPQQTVIVGFVVYVHKNHGKIFVKVDNGYEISELHDVRITSVANNNVLKYNSSLAVWENVVPTTTWITEGTNLYYTQGRFDSAFAAKSTTNLAEGTNLYFTTARGDANFATNFATKTTTNLPEGTNLYFTNQRFDTRFSTKTTTDLAEGTNLYYTQARFNTAFDAKTTTDLDEGTNLYYTDARARAAISENAVGLDYSSGSGVLSLTAGYAIPTTVKLGQYDTAYNRSIVSAGVTGTTTKTLSLTQQDANVITASWTDQGITTINGTANQIAANTVGNTTTIGFTNDVTMPNNLVVSGNLTINGTATYVNTQSISAKDPLFEVANDNNTTDAVDIGYYGRYYDSAQTRVEFTGLFRDASDAGKFKFFTGLTVEPTNVVDTTGTGYTIGTLVANVEGSLAGTANAANTLTTARTIAASGDATWSVSFNGSANVSSALTLANTGVTATTYGTTTAVPTIAVDSKGRITSASNTNIAFPVTTVNGASGTVVLTTSNIAEGSNQYFTSARAQASITGGASSVVTANLTASRALVSDGTGKIAASASTTATELSYVAGVTSAIQTQLNTKALDSNTVHISGTETITGTKTFSASLNGAAATFTSLQVNGAQTISNAGSGDYLTIQNTDPSIGGGETVSLVLDYTQAASSTGWKILSRYAGGNLQFVPNYQNAGYNTPALSLNYNGAATFTFDNNSSGVVYSRNVSGTIYELGSVKNSGSDILYQGTGNVFINADSNSDSTASDRNVIFGNRGVEYARITSGGNVGIGTSSPSGKLHLSSTGDTYLVMTGGSTPLTYSWLVDATNLRLFNGVGVTTLMTIASTGAATFSSSITALNYFSTAATTSYAYSYYANSGAAMYMGIERSTGGGLMTGSSAYATIFGTTNATSLQFGTNGIIRATITSGGNVGIGATPSNGKLEIQQSATDSALWVQTGGTTSAYTIADFRNGTNSSALRILGNNKIVLNSTSTAFTGLGDKTKHYVVGDGSTNAAAAHGSMFVAAGTGTADTGISVNQGTAGMTMILIASINTSTGTSTNSAVYIVQFYFSGNNTPTATYIGGSSNFVTFSTSGSNTLNLTGSSSGNKSYAWFVNKFGDV